MLKDNYELLKNRAEEIKMEEVKRRKNEIEERVSIN